MTAMAPLAKSGIILAGNRVTLRPLTARDSEDVYASLQDEEATRLTGTQASFSLEDVREHLQRCEKAGDRFDFAIVFKGQCVGEVVLNYIDPSNLCASFRIAVWYMENRNKGFGSEASELILRFAFNELGLNRIELEVYAFNPRAIHVYKRLGFVLEGTRREALNWKGQWVDAHVMAILRKDFDRMQSADEMD